MALSRESIARRADSDLPVTYIGILNAGFPSTKMESGRAVKIGVDEPYVPSSEQPIDPVKDLDSDEQSAERTGASNPPDPAP